MIKTPFIAHSELTNEIYIVVGNEKYCVTEQAVKAVKAIKALEQEPTTKNDLGVDCVARQDVERFIEGFINEYTPEEELEFINLELDGLKHLPPVTPQEPIHGKCNQCKHYEGVHNVQGHAPCSYHKIGGVMWDWYCSQFENEG